MLDFFFSFLFLKASVFFLFFVIDFLTEQIDAIETNSTLVETYKRAHGQPGTFFTNFIEVMGPPSLWLLPLYGAPNTIWTEPLYDDDKENDYFAGKNQIITHTKHQNSIVFDCLNDISNLFLLLN